MRILICPDAYKGTLTAHDAVEAIVEGVSSLPDLITITRIPMTDGGYGAMEVVHQCLPSQKIQKTVRGIWGDLTPAEYLLIDGQDAAPQTAFIEMAQAAGITQVPESDLDPFRATTFGVGELILDAIHRGAQDLIIGLGGSGSNDGGMGMAQSLGIQFLDSRNRPIEHHKDQGYSAGSLKYLDRIDATSCRSEVQQCRVKIVSDVVNPLVGALGATYTYGPQKGVLPTQLASLDEDLSRYARVIQRDVHRDISALPGAGAAGGLGAGLLAFTPATLISGIDWYLGISKFEDAVQAADLIITGEGRIDGQTIQGKTISGIASVAKKYRKPVIALAGSLGEGVEKLMHIGIDRIYDCSKGIVFEPGELKKGAFKRLVGITQIALKEYLNPAVLT